MRKDKSSSILLIEDHRIAQKVADMIFTLLKYDYEIAENAKEAKILFQENEYGLVFMDIGLPDSNGFLLTEEFRQIEEAQGLKRTPIIGLSVHTLKTARLNGIKAGMDDYLVKPLTIQTCQDIIDRYSLSGVKLK